MCTQSALDLRPADVSALTSFVTQAQSDQRSAANPVGYRGTSDDDDDTDDCVRGQDDSWAADVCVREVQALAYQGDSSAGRQGLSDDARHGRQELGQDGRAG